MDQYVLPIIRKKSSFKTFAFRDKVRMARIRKEIDDDDYMILEGLVTLLMRDKYYRLGFFSLIHTMFKFKTGNKGIVKHLESEMSFEGRRLLNEGISMMSVAIIKNNYSLFPYLIPFMILIPIFKVKEEINRACKKILDNDLKDGDPLVA